MTLKAFFTRSAVLIVAMAAFADDNLPPAPLEHPKFKRPSLTPLQQMEKFGGFVQREYTGNFCYMVNAQSRAGDEIFIWAISQMKQVLSLPILLDKIPEDDVHTFSLVEKSFKTKTKPGAIITIVDIPSQPTLLVANEDGWAQINVAPLAKDNPSKEIFEKRVKKEVWRGFTYLFGGGNSRLDMCLMRPITSLADLDARPSVVPTPEPFNNIMEGARARGITPVRRSTYKRACIEGWAPAPTNDFQKAILEKVRSEKERGPAKAIQIKP
ncbi:MAG: hypothetical protein ACI4UY_13105 [Kiritimatiellia bacterium]